MSAAPQQGQGPWVSRVPGGRWGAGHQTACGRPWPGGDMDFSLNICSVNWVHLASLSTFQLCEMGNTIRYHPCNHRRMTAQTAWPVSSMRHALPSHHSYCQCLPLLFCYLEERSGGSWHLVTGPPIFGGCVDRTRP